MDGRPLHFKLYGINNQNFIMRDRETGTWWQQVTGKAIIGPLKGKQLTLVDHDELSFELWSREYPNGRVLRPDPRIQAKGLYAPEKWEEEIAGLPLVTVSGKNDPLAQRDVVLGIEISGAAKAYPVKLLQAHSPILDSIAGFPVMILLADDGRSVRVFETTLDGQRLEFHARPGSSPLVLIDTATGSEWNFAGEAVAGPLKGKSLKKIPSLKDYWFDWKNYHPDTAVYQIQPAA